ncbi:MAG: squalene/phytoene synthase family protein, partial [Sulfitobacter sp.]|nr:squalene/phytoene synthase family protein [Sulfitobacter sp.]
FPLYAFNLEVSRAPWVTQEAMIAEMRLQWWRDVCEEIEAGGPVRRHEVATPLAAVLTPENAAVLDRLVAARRWDIYREAFEDEAHLMRYLDETAGGLAWVAAQSLGDAEESVVRDAATGAGIAAWLIAVPTLAAQARVPLLDGTPQGVADLAAEGQARLARARRRRGKVSPAARPALLHVGAMDSVLSAARADPSLVGDGQLPDPVEGDRMRLAWRAYRGRW